MANGNTLWDSQGKIETVSENGKVTTLTGKDGEGRQFERTVNGDAGISSITYTNDDGSSERIATVSTGTIKVETAADGSKTTTLQNGNVMKESADGKVTTLTGVDGQGRNFTRTINRTTGEDSITYTNADGSTRTEVTTTEADSVVRINDSNGTIVQTETYADGTGKEIRTYKDGSKKDTTLKGDQKIATSTYDKDGKLTSINNYEYDNTIGYDENEKISSFKSDRDYYMDAVDKKTNKAYYVKYDKDHNVIEVIDKETGKLVDANELKKLELDDDKTVNDFRSNADKYATLSSDDEKFGGISDGRSIDKDNLSKLNGIDTRDRDDVHDEFMHEGHVTQTANLGYTGERPENFHEIENGTDEKGNTIYVADSNNKYEVGKVVQLADNVNLEILSKTVYNTPSGRTYTGNVLGNTNPHTYSKLEYAATYAETGQFSFEDSLLSANALEANGVKFKAHPAKYFNGTELAQIYSDLANKNWVIDSKNLRDEVDQIRNEFKKVHDDMVQWAGESASAAKEAILDILGKFEVPMGNIDRALVPACKAADDLFKKLEELKNAEVKLKELQAAEEKARITLLNTKEEETIYHYDKSSGKLSWIETKTTDAWKAAKKNLEAAEQAVEEQKTKMDGIMELALQYLYDIKHYQRYLKTFSDVLKSPWVASKEAVIAFHDTGAWKEYLENYVNMPVITNLSDYHEGDVIIHDDAHGYVYVVTGAFDPLTGTIRIACIDRDGNRIGNEVTIWDQREIVPIEYVQSYDKEYEGYQKKYPKTVPETVPDTVQRSTPKPGGGGGGNHDHDPSPSKNTTPEPITSAPPPITPPPTTPHVPITQPHTMPPTKPYVPGITPTTTIDYVAPHTGLDAVYQSNDKADTTQSSASLGALAGLAVGAAGLGLTGLMGEKEDKEKKEENIEKQEEKTENDNLETFDNILEKKDNPSVDEK